MTSKAEALHYGRHASGAVSNWDCDAGRGRHVAIIDSHPFVTHEGDENRGCGHRDDPFDLTRCGYYRRHHATMKFAIYHDTAS